MSLLGAGKDKHVWNALKKRCEVLGGTVMSQNDKPLRDMVKSPKHHSNRSLFV